jgi:uroporphyrinogen III methyltransferase/synthase
VKTPRVTFVCVGPGDPGLLTVRARATLLAAKRVHISGHQDRVGLVARVLESAGVLRDKISHDVLSPDDAEGAVIAHSSHADDLRAVQFTIDSIHSKVARVVRVPGVSPEAAEESRRDAPLRGKRILVLRAKEQSADAESLLFARGAEPRSLPMISIAPPPDPARLLDAAKNASSYAFVVFTSQNGVARFFDVLNRQLKRDARALAPAKIAAIGPKTAEALRPFGIVPDLVATEFVGESLAKELAAALPAASASSASSGSSGSSARILIPRALVARDVVPDTLRALGHTVDVVPAYETRGPDEEDAQELRAALEKNEADAVLFTSSSTVENAVASLGADAKALLARVVVASIGPVTTETAKKLGIAVNVTAERFTLEGVADALEAHFAN